MYIKRDRLGQICACSKTPEDDMLEHINDDAAELQEFLQRLKTPQQVSLEQSDQSMARVLEDVINLLVDKGTIRFTDLPDAAQQKLLNRRELRDQRQGINLLDDGDDLKI
jgi:hypothetical protein